MVLSGMPIDLIGLAQTALTRLSGGRLPPVEGSDPVADVAAADFSVTLPSLVPNGLPVRALIVAVGADGRPVPFSGEATLSSSDPAARFPETITLTRGRAFVSVTFATAGEQTLSVTTAGDAPISGSDTTQVAAPVAATQLALRLPPTTRIGAPVPVMIMALDANGRSVPGFTGELSFASSDEAATLPETVSFVRGRAVATVTFGTAGEQTLTATAGDLVAEAKTTVATQPAVADFRIELPSDAVVGRPIMAVAVAIDGEGKPIRDFSGSAALASSDEGATLPETVQFRWGRAYFQVAFATLGEQQITVTSGEVTASAATTVKAAPSVTSLSLWLPGKVVAGLPMIAQVMALDAEGRPVRSFNGSFTVTSSDADATLPSTVEFLNGIALIRVAFATTGLQTLTVTDPANAELAATASSEVMALVPNLPPWLRR